MTENTFIKNDSILRNKLFEFIYGCTKCTTDYYIAVTFVEKLAEFPNVYIEEIAYKANTTAASVTRFCHKIGYTSFKALKNDCNTYNNFYNLQVLSDDFSLQSPLDTLESFNVFNKELLKKIFGTLDKDIINKVAESIKKTKNIIILTPLYALTPVTNFSELVSAKNILVYKLSPHVNDQIFSDLSRKGATIILISLTGGWFEDKQQLLQNIKQHQNDIFLFGTDKSIRFKKECTDFYYLGECEELLSSVYISFKTLILTFFLLANLL